MSEVPSFRRSVGWAPSRRIPAHSARTTTFRGSTSTASDRSTTSARPARPLSLRNAITSPVSTPGGSRRFTPTWTCSALPFRVVSMEWTFTVRERNPLSSRRASANARRRSRNDIATSTVVGSGEDRCVRSPANLRTRLMFPLYPIVTPDHPLGSPTRRKSGRWGGIRWRAPRESFSSPTAATTRISPGPACRLAPTRAAASEPFASHAPRP